MSHNATPNTSRVELRKTLTLVPVVMMGLAYMQPMTLFDTFGIVSGMTDGHVPTAYAFALIAILFTALSYGKLVRRYPSAGSAYTYAQKSISPTVGFMVGSPERQSYRGTWDRHALSGVPPLHTLHRPLPGSPP